MTVSTDAILFWGFCLPHEDEGMPWDDERWEGGTDNYYAFRLGILPPSVECSDKTAEIYESYWRKVIKLDKAEVCGIGYHCSDSYPMQYIAVLKSVTVASRGCPKEVDILAIKSDWREELKRYCEIMGIEWQEPRWWLASYSD